MTVSQDQELQAWVSAWQTASERPIAVDEVGVRVRQRIRRLRLWAATEAVVGVVALAVVSYRFVFEAALFEKVAMALLGVIALSGLALSWWQWQGVWRASAASTAEFLTGSMERSRRLQRYLAAGWVLLVAEVAVFVPWIRYRLDSRPATVPQSVEWFAWGLLTVMVAGAAVFLLIAQRRVRSERESLAAIERELSAIDL